MKKLLVRLALVVLVMLMGVTAYAQDAGACDVAAPASPTQVTMIGWTFPILDFYAAELAACSEVSNLTVNTQLLASADAQAQMRLAASSTGASPYDIVHGSNNFINEVARQGWLLPLNDLIAQYDEQFGLTTDIDASVYGAVTQNGSIYGMPIVVNTQFFYYNTAILEAAGIEPPQTYEDVIAACEAMDTDALDIDFAFGMVLSAGWAWQLEWENLFLAYGGQLLDENNMPTFNSEAGVAAVDLLVDVVNACLGQDGLLLSTDDLQAGIANGSIAMGHMWASRAAMMDNPEQSDVVGLIEFAPALYPNSDGTKRGGIAWADYLAIPAASAVDKDLLFQIIMQAADAASQAEATQFGLVPRASAQEGAPRYSTAALQTIAEGGETITNPARAVAATALGQFLPRVITGELTAQAALDGAAEVYITEATARGFIQ
jgi:ABC-type glycerol-3-phosphate transport system substrate-binding protein